jgi:hypothetical protein
MIGISLELKPPDWNALLSPSDRRAVLRRSYDQLLKRCPNLGLAGSAPDGALSVGGVIFAWGRSDIHESDSRLHTRHEIGIYSLGHYHSVNTGKYTMIPYLGYRTAERILGIA